jgi:GDPmannose 4,6-dehydratase
MEDNNTLFDKSYDIHVKWYLILLESIKKFSPTTKIFYASSCLVFGWTETEIQNEDTIPCPNWIYWITKLDWMYLSKLYRDNYKILASAGILYNHESEYRLPKFVSMKIIQWAIDIKNWKSDKLIIWNLSAKVDRWYAYDYVEAMYKILQYKEWSDFIISSWEIHTVQELVEITFKYLWLDWIKYVIEDNKIIKRNLWLLYWDNTKIVNLTWWKPKHTFIQMIHKIIDSTIQTQKH